MLFQPYFFVKKQSKRASKSPSSCKTNTRISNNENIIVVFLDEKLQRMVQKNWRDLCISFTVNPNKFLFFDEKARNKPNNS